MRGWAGRLALAAALLAGVGAAPCYAAEEKPATQARERTFDLHIQGGKVAADKRVIKVAEGDRVRLRWRSDAPLTLHLHGYDIERRVAPGTVAEMNFTASMTGRFSVSIHGEAKKGGHHHAPLAQIEVHPR